MGKSSSNMCNNHVSQRNNTYNEDSRANLPLKGQIAIVYDDLVCAKCQTKRIDRQMHRAFGEQLCKECRGEVPLISQSRAIDEYLLTASDLSLLPYLETANPISTMYKPMRLYQQEVVAQLSQRKFPDLAAERAKRKEQQQLRKQARIKKKIAALKRSTRPKLEKSPAHHHTFDSSGQCPCGLVVEQEEL
ncbi:DNA-repair protein complementing XP-A cells [Nematocida homosporus]|uniref:DNA-repair protein complementing XP-A cells n=1 Tax=Nematocida homosporus TaxID=1912981 RepID=UPI00221EBB17|nr:DNA-repair protein complementing XP-A cells [Nematocida homosporus]KAI5184526.1 DNA-repair protein complementing XP-A cells [Nematocida homosporus]